MERHLKKAGAPSRALLNGAALGVLGLAAAAAAPAAAQEATNVQEIIVTATRRAETLQDVPVAVTAITAEAIARDRVQNFVDVAPLVPGARFVATKGSAYQMAIRGQTQMNDSPALEVPVGVFIDDLYYGSLGSFDADFFDVEQIAVLRGPQGTTFGRNVVGGAVQVTTRRPSLGDNNAEVALTYLDRPGFETRGFVNLSPNEQFAARLAFSTHHVDGYVKNRVTGNDLADNKSYSARLSLRYQPTETVDVNFNVQTFRRDSLGGAARTFGQGAYVANLNQLYPDIDDVLHDADGVDKRRANSATLHVDVETGLGVLTSATGYRTLDAFYHEDLDSTTARPNHGPYNDMEEWAFSQEFRLASSGERRLEYVLGVYYGFESLYKDVEQSQLGQDNPQLQLTVLTRGRNQFQIPEQRARVLTAAPFGEFKYHITDQWAVTAGARYTYERKAGFTNHIGVSVFYGPEYFVDWEESWTAFTPRFILHYEPNENLNFYASASKGFKGGGWSLTATSPTAAVTPLDPETSWSYELGAKTQLLDRRLVTNVAIYRADTSNLQVRSLQNGVFVDRNAGKARVEGVEFEGRFSPIPAFQLGLNFAYTNARYADFRGCTAAGADCTGNPLPHAPKRDLLVFASYDFDLGERGSLTLKADAKWTSKFTMSPLKYLPGGDYVEAVKKTSVEGLVNASALYAPPQGDWDLQVWVRNLTNERYIYQYSTLNFYVLSPAEFASGLRYAGPAWYNPPRTAGVTLTYRFN